MRADTFRFIAVKGLLCAGITVAMAAVAGCQPPFPDVLRDAEGQPVRVDAVQSILSDTGLTEADQRQALRDLGIEDESLIELLIRSQD